MLSSSLKMVSEFYWFVRKYWVVFWFTNVIFWPFKIDMHGEMGPLTFSYATPRDYPFLKNSNFPEFRSTLTYIVSFFLEHEVYYSIIFLCIFWPLRHIMPHSFADDPKWFERLQIYLTWVALNPWGICATPIIIYQELEDASIFKSI